jgi:hypothetical protein
MPSQDDYYNRLRTLHGPLLQALQADFMGNQKWFSGDMYKSPEFRSALLMSLARESGGYSVPSEITQSFESILGSGPVLSLYSGLGEFLFQFGGEIGVERSMVAAEWAQFLLKIAGIKAEIVITNPLQWESNRKFDRIVCSPPFGTKDAELGCIEKALSMLEKDGQVAAIVSPHFLWGNRQAKGRETILERASIGAVISLPANVFARTSVSGAILVLKQGSGAGDTYMARSKNLSDLSAIASDFNAWRRGQKFTVGFEVALDSGRWDVAFHEPVDFGLGGLRFPYRLITLGDIAKIEAGKSSADAKIAINRTGSKVVWVPDDSNIIPKNNFFIVTGKELNPSYLHLYLNSAIGTRALCAIEKGAHIPHISGKDLDRLPIVLPELRQQNQIVADALELNQTVASLQILTIEMEEVLKDNLFGLAAAKQKFQQFSATTERTRYQQLPFPIAVVQRKIANAPNNTQRFSLLIELFEVAVRFIALVHLADYVNNRKQPAVIAEQVPDIKKLFAPALGDWVNIFKAFARIKSAPHSAPFLAEIKNFGLDKYQRTLQEFVDIRNASLRGHGATLTEEEYELRFQEHAPKVFDLVSSLGFLSNYTLVKTGQMEKNGDFFKVAVHYLMGDNPHFEAGYITVRTPLDTNRVLYLNREQESLVLDPYVVLERCPECKRPEVLLFDKLSNDKITYLGYESGHRPSLPNADRLPVIIRETATRRI